MPMLFCIPNLATHTVTRKEPWKFLVSGDAPTTRNEYKAWWKRADSPHLLFSCFEGLNPNARVGKGNAAVVLHGFVADYDTAGGRRTFTEDDLTNALATLEEGRKPTWSSRTISGGIRLVWLFERPIQLPNREFAKRFVDLGTEELLMEMLLVGLDRNVLNNHSQYYDVGTDWREHGPALGRGFLDELVLKASKSTDWSKEGGCVIPIEARAAEAAERYSGRWSGGTFEIGARSVRFWDPMADNPTGCVVMERGFTCFTGPKSWVSDEEVFGPAFVRKHNEGRIVGACAGIYAESTCFWMKTQQGRWANYRPDSVRRELQFRGLAVDPKTKDGMGEVSQAIRHIETAQRVAGAAPMIYVKEELARLPDGNLVVNLSNVRPMDPSGEQGETWGPEGRFPWLSAFFDSWVSPEQRPFLLGWIKRFYSGAVQGCPNRGHAVFFAGPADSAKSFFWKQILHHLAGGSCLAARFVMGETEFNKAVAESPVWVLDDASLADNDAARRKFAGKLKSFIATPTVEYRGMYRDGVLIENFSRIVCCLNDDPVSITLLPPLDGAIEDKVMFFHVSKPNVEFYADQDQNETRVVSELPHFLQWLLEWPMPPEIEGGRYGLRGEAAIHPTLRHEGAAADGTIDYLEAIREAMHHEWLPDAGNGKMGEAKPWVGKASDLLLALHPIDRLSPLLRNMTARGLAQKLGRLAAIAGSGVSVAANTSARSGTKTWRIEP